MAKKKAASTRKSAKKTDSPVMPKRIFAQASPMSIGGLSIFDAGALRILRKSGEFLS